MKFRNKKTGEIKEFNSICINSSLVSAQNRKRLYWTNIKGVKQPEDKGIYLKDIIDHRPHPSFNLSITSLKNLRRNFGSKGRDVTHADKCGTIGASMGAGGGNVPYITAPPARKLTPVECERLQTLPDNYTWGVSNTQRYKAIGNGWTVDVIAHIFKNL